MQEYIKKRGWEAVMCNEDTASGVRDRKKRERILLAARKRQLDVIVVRKPDRLGRSLVDLMNSLQELTALRVSFVSIATAIDLTTPSGKALAGMLAVFAEFERDMLREQVKVGIAHTRAQGKPHGRPGSASLKAEEVKHCLHKVIVNLRLPKNLALEEHLCKG